MIIANPIYDIVFKYLMEDLDIARGIISRIINEDIIELNFHAQEHTAEKGNYNLTFFRLDFKAKIRVNENDHKIVLIELQKTRLATDIERFRNYIGNQYKQLDEISDENGEVYKTSLPIITIFFLGDTLSSTLPASLKINRQYADLITGEVIEERHAFIEALSHDMYVVQIPVLPEETQTELEELLAIFCQDHPADDSRHSLVVDEDKLFSKFNNKILRRLRKLVEEPKIREQMDVEDEICRMLEAELDEKTRELKHQIKEETKARLQAELEKRQAEEREMKVKAENECMLKNVAEQMGITIEEARKKIDEEANKYYDPSKEADWV